jgi:hypothetical protein
VSVLRSLSILLILLITEQVVADDLFMFEERKVPKKKTTSCHWLTVPAEQITSKNRKPNLIHTSKTCPRYLIWNPAKKSAVYILEEDIYEWNWLKGSTKRLIKLPPSAKAAMNDFFVASNGKIRVSMLHYISDDKVKKKAGKNGFMFRGKWIQEYKLDWGENYVAEVLELNHGSWKSLAISATVSGAGGTPGITVLNDYLAKAKGVVTQNDLLETGICRLMGCDLEQYKGAKGHLEALKIDPESDWGYLPFSKKKSGILFAAAFGDSPHAVPPVFICKGNCAKPKKITVKLPSQLSISVKGEFALITNEYYGDKAHLFRAGSERPIVSWPKAQSVVWLPFSVGAK